MEKCRELLTTGKQQLFSHQSHDAMVTLSKSLELCDCSNPNIMGEILFFLGLAFMNLGQGTSARRCWLNAFTVRDSRPDAPTDHAEWKLFHMIQVNRYLKTKSNGRFDTLAEGDMIHDLIKTTWEEISMIPELAAMNPDDRISYYSHLTIYFPENGPQQERTHRGNGRMLRFLGKHE